MTSLAPTTQLPESFAFDDDTAPLRPAAASRSSREELKFQILAHEIVRYAPDLTRLLRRQGLARMRAELQEA
ncbi:MAG TPA: hypothetical protein VGH65_04270 [Verrucomicrobiaceae bacterium]